MFIAKVTGSMVSTQKVESMVGHKLMIVEPFRLSSGSRKKLETTGRTFVAVDTLGSGVGDFVLITQGSSARLTPETKNMPIDSIVKVLITPAQGDRKTINATHVTGDESQSTWSVTTDALPSLIA